jgi:magnesium transporter
VDGYIVNLDGSSAPASRKAVEDALSTDELLWLDLRMPDDEAVDMLRDVFKFHPVALEDVGEFGQRPKAERFGDVVYIVAYAATALFGELIEVHAFYAENFLVTARRRGCDSLDEVRRRVELGGGLHVPADRPLRGVMLHHVLDSMIDSFFQPLSDLDDKIDELQEQIFANPSKENLATMLSMQRWLVGLRKTVSPQRDVMAAILSSVVELPGHSEGAVPYLRDLYDHVIRTSDLIDSYRDLLSGAMDAYLSMVSNKLNEVMKQLTIIATVFLPLSFLTGFFGQNFAFLVSHIGNWETFVFLGLGTELLAVVGLFWMARRRRWL